MDPDARSLFYFVLYAILIVVFIAVIVAILDNRGVILVDLLRSLVAVLRSV